MPAADGQRLGRLCGLHGVVAGTGLGELAPAWAWPAPSRLAWHLAPSG